MTRRPIPSPSSRAFTMLEVMLAGSLGLIVLFSALAFFSTMDRSKRFQEERMETNAEFATAHRVIQQALRSLLMADGAAAAGRDEDDEKKIEDNIKDALDHPDERLDDTTSKRLCLEPDKSIYTPDGRPSQTLELTVATPPIHAVSMRSEAEQEEAEDLRQMLNNRRRGLDLWDSSRSSSARLDSSSSSSSSAERDPDKSTARSDHLRAASEALSGTAASSDALSHAAHSDADAPRAPGMRGVFELRAEDDQKLLARLNANSAGGVQSALSLWWRQIPPDDDTLLPQNNASGSGTPRAPDPQLLELARRSRADAPQIKILSGLKNARWKVYRRRTFVEKMDATQAKELPAYVEFSFETISGRKEDWLFEVAWTYGAEPGTIVATNDPLGGPAVGSDLASQINNAVNNAVNGQNPNGNNASGGGGKPVASTTGGGNSSGGSTGGTRGPGNTSQADIDAILRQFGFHR